MDNQKRLTMNNTEKYLNDEFDFDKIKTNIESRIDLSLPTKESYAQFLVDYAEFNYVFAGCVSMLAGRFHISPTNNDCPVLNKVSHLVAQNIFEAATDEYEGVTHKGMANYLSDSVRAYYDKDLRPSTLVKSVVNLVRHGYGASNSDNSYTTLLTNLGFHIASEQLASFEFSYLDKKIQEGNVELHETLTSIYGDKNKFHPWLWVEIHGEVEEEHAQFAYKAADLILNELDEKERTEALNCIKAGFEFFILTQENFFKVTTKSPFLTEA